MDVFELTKKKIEASQILLAAFGINPSLIENKKNFALITQFFYRQFLLVPCKTKLGDFWKPTIIVFENEKIKLILRDTREKIFTSKFSNEKLQSNLSLDHETIITVCVDGENSYSLRFENREKALIILEVFNVIISCDQVQRRLEYISHINKRDLLDEQDFLNAMVICHWGRKSTSFDITFKEQPATIILKKHKLIITLFYKIKIPISLNFKIFKDQTDATQLILKSQGYKEQLLDRNSYTLRFSNELSRNYLIWLISLKFRIPSLKFIHTLLTSTEGSTTLHSNHLFEHPLYREINKEKVVREMNMVIGSQRLKAPIFLFYTKVSATLILDDKKLKITRVSGDSISCEYKNVSLFMNKKNTSVFLLQISNQPSLIRVFFQPKNPNDSDIIINSFFFFKFSSPKPSVLWKEEHARYLSFEMENFDSEEENQEIPEKKQIITITTNNQN
ncbi:hypothetical protein M0811_14394 [Anaeramoeba ignava]|uniref:Uncharacterized protein n=1 Tax=Anaeramoeba ignava TaxID=1746090 RepID=A0A9Q0LVN3_ANAIG|nr:hypothetical protein M0811_14394 [Anaeramoeba ignava]